MNKYYKNIILCGELDFHCLLCKESFEMIPDVEKHIRWEKHRHNLKHQNNIPKYKEFIHKIGELYYCEICNHVVKFEALQQHIKSDDHKIHKSNPGTTFKRTGLGERDESSSIKFPKLLINRLQWHGINNMKCLLCNEAIENANAHISTTKHMMYIIQSQVVENANHYFRKIEDNTFYCFGCSEIITDSLNKHICKKEKGKKNKKNDNKNDESEKKCESPGFIKILADIEKDKYDINIKEKTAKCKICDASVDVTLKAMSKHTVKYHEDTIQYVDPVDHGKRRSNLAKYGKENFIKLNEGGSKGYCSLCDIYISAHMKVATAHVNGLRHRGHLEIKGLRAHKKHTVPGCRALALQHFLKDMFHAKPLNSMCINFSICVDALSFMLVTKIYIDKQEKGKCFCCDVVFKWDDLKEHWGMRKHRNAFASADVLLMEEEFIRVIRPGLFHCGFCNQALPFWETVAKHIASWTHSIAKKKNELACTLAMQWYTEQETNGAVRFSDDLYLQCIELGIVQE